MNDSGKCCVIRIGSRKSAGSRRSNWLSAWMPPVDAPIATISKSLPGAAAPGGVRGMITSSGATSRVSFSLSKSPKRPANAPASGLTNVSAAPSASACTVVTAPSSHAEETISTRAPWPAAIKSGSAVRPSLPGISTSSTITSTRCLARKANTVFTADTAPATTKRPAPSIARAMIARATTESSTIRTDGGASGLARSGCCLAIAPVPGKEPRSGHADDLELGFERLAVERLHENLVSAGFDRGADIGHAVLGRAEHHFGPAGERRVAERAQEIHPAHHRHVPVEQDDVGHRILAAVERLASVGGLAHLEIERFEDVAGDLPDHLGIVDNQARLHDPNTSLLWPRSSGLERNHER